LLWVEKKIPFQPPHCDKKEKGLADARLKQNKAAAHVAVDLQCWFTVKHVKERKERKVIK